MSDNELTARAELEEIAVLLEEEGIRRNEDETVLGMVKNYISRQRIRAYNAEFRQAKRLNEAVDMLRTLSTPEHAGIASSGYECDMEFCIYCDADMSWVDSEHKPDCPLIVARKKLGDWEAAND